MSQERGAEVRDWLLEKAQPSVRYFSLLDLLGRSAEDPDVKEARSRLGRAGWAAEILRRQRPQGFWERREPRNVAEVVDFLYQPPFRSTNWQALVLADLGLDRSDPRVRRIADLIFAYKLRLGSPFNFFHEEACIAGNTARMMTRFGYGDDPRVRKLYDWLLEDQREDGGWNCSQGTPGTLDVWEPLAALACVPTASRSPSMTRSIERGAEFYLERKLLEEGRRYAPWYRLHYPNHYFYDVLVGLDLLTRLGFSDDRRLRPALALLKKKRTSDGRWRLDKAHPDVGAGVEISSEPSKVKPLRLEREGAPSKWITLKALTVLKRTGESE